MQEDIVYRHQEWVVLNKPEGQDVKALSEYYQNQFESFHPVHRLDKDTSGLWLVALTEGANRYFSKAFQDRSIEKMYLAITRKKPSKKQGIVKGDMERSRRGQWMLKRSMDNPAETRFRSVGIGDGLRLVGCWPKSGKTHQIRVAMKSLGSPIAGDVIYDPGESQAFDRLYLHAFAIAFEWQGQRYAFQLAPRSGRHFNGQDFEDALEQII